MNLAEIRKTSERPKIGRIAKFVRKFLQQERRWEDDVTESNGWNRYIQRAVQILLLSVVGPITMEDTRKSFTVLPREGLPFSNFRKNLLRPQKVRDEPAGILDGRLSRIVARYGVQGGHCCTENSETA